VATMTVSSAAFAQSINFVQNHTTSSPGNTPPPLGYHAAAVGQPGVADPWNSFVGSVTAGAVIPMASAPGVTLTVSHAMGQIHSTANLIGATPEQGNLMASFWNVGSSTVEDRILTFNGLANGVYDVYTYAMASDSPNFFSRVNVNAPAADGTPGAQTVGGAFAGAYQQGLTHALHQGVVVDNGSLAIYVRAAVSWASLSGIQLVMIPAPGAVALLGVAGLLGTRRRRD
jgi:hypothetical protein